MAQTLHRRRFRAKVALIRPAWTAPPSRPTSSWASPARPTPTSTKRVALAKEVAFAKMHVFAFSARKGTAAAKMRPRSLRRSIKARSQTLRTLDRDLQTRFRDQFLGETAQVLIESYHGRPAGRAERYFEVEIGHGTDRTDGTNGTDPRERRPMSPIRPIGPIPSPATSSPSDWNIMPATRSWRGIA